MFRFCKEVCRIGIQSKHTKGTKRSILLRDNLGRVKDIKSKCESLVLIENLHIELPLRVIARLNSIEEVLSVKVGIFAGNMLCFVPDQASLALLSFPVPFYELGVTFFVYESECVDAVAVLESALAYMLGLQPMSCHCSMCCDFIHTM